MRRLITTMFLPPKSVAINTLSAIRSQSHGLRTKPSRFPPRRKSHSEEDGLDKHNPWEDGGGGSGVGRFQLHKSRGQHLLTNPRVLDSIVRRARVLPSDTVLEIGPGTGNLTLRLLQSARHVVTVEIDDRMVGALQNRVSQLGLSDRLTVITDNALRTQFPEFDICVANIPYRISSPLIAKLLFEMIPARFRSATLLLQKEFARRLLATPGDSEYNRLAVNVGLVATVEFLMDVSKKDFVPCPKVDSTLVGIRPREEVPAVDFDEWLAFTRTCFGKRNKTLGAIFKQKKKISELLERSRLSGECKELEREHEDVVEYDDNGDVSDEGDKEEEGHGSSDVALFKEKIVGILRAGGFEEKRPSKLSNEELLCLLKHFNQEGILFR